LWPAAISFASFITWQSTHIFAQTEGWSRVSKSPSVMDLACVAFSWCGWT
jgi:hypothetical protein